MVKEKDVYVNCGALKEVVRKNPKKRARELTGPEFDEVFVPPFKEPEDLTAPGAVFAAVAETLANFPNRQTLNFRGGPYSSMSVKRLYEKFCKDQE